MIIELEKVNKENWNTWMMHKGIYGTIFQSTYWAEYLKKTYGDNPIYIASLNKNGEFQGSLLAIMSSYAKHPFLTELGKKGQILGKLYKYIASPILRYKLPFIYWENGPMIIPNDSTEQKIHREDIYKNIIGKIVDIAQEKNCYEIKFARPTFFGDYSDIFSLFGFENRRMGTLLINLDQPTEVLWKRINRKARNSVKSATAQGLEITKVSKLDELKEFYSSNVQARKRAKIKVFPFSYFTLLWNHFSPLDKIVVFIARIKDKPVAAHLYLNHNKIIHLITMGDSDYARSNRMHANDFLMWYAIKWAHERGFRYFDLSGVELYKIDAGYKKAQNIYRYKNKWGGQLVEYNDYKKSLHEKKLLNFLNLFLSDSVIHN